MLRRSFVHLPGVGQVTEKKLWSRGILSWQQLHDLAESLFKHERALSVREQLTSSEEAYQRGDLHFFSERFPKDSLWRLVPDAGERIAYLDIETTGLGFPPISHSTTITFYFGGRVLQEHDHERKRELIRWVLQECTMICTYFGEAFDVPFLKHEFGIDFARPHLDLCFWLKRLGFRGGLKRVQRMFEDIPERSSMDIDGFDAVRLWRLHERGVPGALDTLLAYNAEDTIVLEALLIHAFNREVDRHPELGLRKLPSRTLPELPTRVDPTIYRRLRSPVLGSEVR